jgi:hypothetical protein
MAGSDNFTSLYENARTRYIDEELQRMANNDRYNRLPFLLKLHEVLDSEGGPKILSWIEDGKSFRIDDPRALDGILQSHFSRKSPTFFDFILIALQLRNIQVSYGNSKC